jgi:hypothetical protein
MSHERLFRLDGIASISLIAGKSPAPANIALFCPARFGFGFKGYQT